MLRLGKRSDWATWLFALLCGVSGTAPGAQLGGLPYTQLVQVIEADEREGHVDISVQFSCTVHYVGNTPLNHGKSTTITLRLGADCGSLLSSVAPEFPLVGGGGQLVTSATLEAVVPGEVTLELRWAQELSFVMAPTASSQGLRVRLLGTSRAQSGGYVTEAEPAQGYAINLDSSMEIFDPATVQAAASALHTPAYVSETDIDDKHWFRLRVGPFTTRAEAERVLRVSQALYPRAWVAINDEVADLAAVDHADVASAASGGPTDPPLSDEERDQILGDARSALEQRQFPQAVELLTRLLRQPEYAARAQAQELMGLVRERAGQLAHAKAEYKEYLRRYPNGAAAARVRERLRALVVAEESPQSTGNFGGSPIRSTWNMAGSGALTYQYGQDQLSGAGPNATTTSLNALLVYGDFLARDRGERFDFTARVDGGYTANMVPNTGGSQDRVTSAYVELSDRTLGLTGRVGRQSLATAGAIGLFDGVFGAYQIAPRISLSAAGGFPAYTSYSQISGQQTFGTLSAQFGPFRRAWVFDGYLFDEVSAASTERRAVGFQTRYFTPRRSAILLADYDIEFRQLNSVTLIGNLALGARWVLGFDADHRRSPLLLLSNALIGQSAADLSMLETQFTPSQIKQLALDRTATSSTYTLSATHPIGEHWQLLGSVSALQLSGTPASGGVAATTSTGLDKNSTLQLSGSSLIQASDLHFFGVRYDDSLSSRSTTLSWDARFVLTGAWRLGPRLSVEELNNPTLGGRQILYLPELRGDWTGKRSVFEFIGGYQVQQQQALAGQSSEAAQNARHLYVSGTYRLRF